jgi:hypothetical protein
LTAQIRINKAGGIYIPELTDDIAFKLVTIKAMEKDGRMRHPLH